MIQIQPSDDDLDRVMIQIERWSGSRWLEDEDDLKTKMTWRWLKDEDDPVDTEKKTSDENCVERIPS